MYNVSIYVSMYVCIRVYLVNRFHRDTSPLPSHVHSQPNAATGAGNLTQSPGGGAASKPRSTPPRSSPPQNNVCMYACPIEFYYEIVNV